MQKAELVFIPLPGVSHLISTVEIAKLLVGRDDRLSITVLIIKFPNFDSNVIAAYTRSLDRIKFIDLPNHFSDSDNSRTLFFSIIESQKPHVKEAVTKLTQSESLPAADSPRLAGFVLDMFCTCMIDVANDFGVPSYIFFTSGAAFLGLMFHAQFLHDELGKSTTDFKDSESDAELVVPSLANPVPARVLPSAMLSKEWSMHLNELSRRFRTTKGIMVNTFAELESYAVNSLSDGSKTQIPPLYPVGPILNLNGDNHVPERKAEIMEWLDDQPPSSVVFLCFGSMGSFDGDQLKEIACALEQSGHRFLWSVRQSPPKDKDKDKIVIPNDCENLTDVLPEGFLDRTVGIGKVIGWAPQVAVLGHPAVGGFVSHCGWNSTLESIWFGVPIATWPIYAEQQLNAFEMVRELGLAVEIKMDYRKDFITESVVELVTAEEIERGIRRLMESDNNDIRKKVKEMSEKSRRALMDGGSSFSSLGRFIGDVIDNIS
nr:UGT1 [Aesculus chinensis]